MQVTYKPDAKDVTISRRRALRSGALAVGAGALAIGGSSGVGGAQQNNLVRRVREDGYYGVINAGSRNQKEGEVMDHFYRSDRPLREETNEGGVVQVHPGKGGIHTEIQLTTDDNFGSAGITPGDYPLGKIGVVELETRGDPVGMALKIENSSPPNNDFFAWEPVNGHKERFIGFDGDILAPGFTVGSGSITIDRHGHKFGGKTIAEWTREVGRQTSAQIGVAVQGSTSKEATVESFAVEPPGDQNTGR